MTHGAPLCVHCRVKPVRRRKGTTVDKRGPRIIDGIRWNWYCSPQCGGADLGVTNVLHPHFQAGSKALRLSAERRALARLMALCKGKMDEHQRVHVKDMVRAFMEERQAARLRGYSAAMLRLRRGASYRKANCQIHDMPYENCQMMHA